MSKWLRAQVRSRASHRWSRHFRFQGPYIVGRTAIGRVTVSVLSMNNRDRIELRQNLIAEGRFSPADL